jgi:heterodisulfide reductase subunit D
VAELVSQKDFYDEPIGKDGKVSLELEKDAYLVFACRHKFCREVCPVYLVTRDEAHTSYGFHTALLSVARGLEKMENLPETLTHCLECGGCCIKCPNTLFAADFYMYETTTVDLVRKLRRDDAAAGRAPKAWKAVQEYVDGMEANVADQEAVVTRWADGLPIDEKASTVLFVDFFTATQGTEGPTLLVKILKKLGVKVGVWKSPGVTCGEKAETDPAGWWANAKAVADGFRAKGIKKVIVLSPHDYTLMVKEWPKKVDTSGYEVVFFTDYLADLMAAKAPALKPVNRTVTYHDPCTINKQCDINVSPRQLLNMIPGLDFRDEDPVTQWSYCCGNGMADFKQMLPDIAYRIGTTRLRQASDMGADALVLACPHCKDQLTEAKTKAGMAIEPLHIVEVVAAALGVE